MSQLQYTEIGIVKSSAGCIAKVTGLKNCFLGQLIKFGYGTEGIIMGFDLEIAKVLIIKEKEPIKPGSECIATLEPFNVPVGDKLIGRIINPLSEPIDGMGPIESTGGIPFFNEAPKLMERKGLSRTMETGVKLVDSTLPLGRGQRSLILGDKGTGKTTILTDIILNQKGKDVVCIYCGIGKTRSAMARVVELFNDMGAFDYTIVMSAPASASPGLIYLAPYAACSVAEHFLYQGKDVFIGFDDFTKHAWSYREVSLLMEVPPGRDSYPGDVFYLHSRMIERAAQYDDAHGGGSITFIPIVELLEGDMTAYVPTNLVSMTDGQLFLSQNLFNEGFRPAVDIGLSVSRVGSKVQWKAMKEVTKSIRLEFIQYKELVKISKLQTGTQSDEMKQKLASGKTLETLLTQPPNSPVSMEAQVLSFYAKNKGDLDGLNTSQVKQFQTEIVDYIRGKDAKLLDDLREAQDLTPEIEEGMKKYIAEYVREMKSEGESKTPTEPATQ